MTIGIDFGTEADFEAGDAWVIEPVDEEDLTVGVIRHRTHKILVVSNESDFGFAFTREGAHALVRELLVALKTSAD